MRLLAPAGADIDQALVDVIDKPVATATALLHGLDAGNEAMLREVATQVASGDLIRVVHALTMPLLVEDDAGSSLGALLAMPPVALMRRWNEHGIPVAATLVGATAVTKLVAVAVDPRARGFGLGASLLRRTTELYQRVGANILYGQFRADSGLDRFYTQCGFQVLDEGEGINLDFLLGVPTGLGPLPGDRLFARWL